MAKNPLRNAVDLIKIYAPGALLAAGALLLAYQFVDPAPPDSLTIATGSEDGAYAHFAVRYRRFFARNGIRLDIRHTQGSIENLELLAAGQVDIAFVQGGTEDGVTAELYALGSVYFEPLWVFYRGPEVVERLPDLRGARLAVGPPMSGTRALATRLLQDNALDEGVRLLPLGGRAAADALLAAEVDAAFFVSGADSPLIRQLVSTPELRLLDFKRAAAYTRLYPFLSELVLPEGMMDLVGNVPDRDVHLLGPTAQLAVNPQTHPVLQDLAMQALTEVHGPGGWFEAAGRFPSAEFVVFPLSAEAERYYKHGPPFLQRYLPFWAATLIDRLKVMLVPLLVVLLPLFRFMPPLYSWRMRARIYRWYQAIEALEDSARGVLDRDRAAQILAELDRLDDEVRKLEVPLSYAGQAYDLRLHIQLVRDELLRRSRSDRGA